MYVITGATGKTAKPIAEGLLAAGKKVRVIGRNADRMADFKARGAEVFVGDVTDKAAMKKAYAGATAVYALVPPNLTAPDIRKYYNEAAEAMAEAIEAVKPTHVVVLSSVGADMSSGNGPVAGLYDLEQRFNKISGVNVLYLRPGYFMENFFGQLGLIKGMGIMGSPMAGDTSLVCLASQDIGAYGLKRLLALDFTGHSFQELHGPRPVTYNDATKILGAAVGKPNLSYVQFPYDEASKGMQQMAGFSASVADSFSEMAKAFNEGKIPSHQAPNDSNRMPTTLEQFAKVFAHIYQQS